MSLTIDGFCGGENVTPEVTAQTPLIEEILESLVGKVYGANATPDKIVQGYSAYVNQNLIEGTLEEVTQIFGYSKYAVDKFTFSTRTTSYNTEINLSLGEIPEFGVLLDDAPSTGADIRRALLFNPSKVATGSIGAVLQGSATNPGTISASSINPGFSADKVILFRNSSSQPYYAAGVEYTLITFA